MSIWQFDLLKTFAQVEKSSNLNYFCTKYLFSLKCNLNYHIIKVPCFVAAFDLKQYLKQVKLLISL